MHFEILVEDRSGKTFLETIMPRIINESHSFRVIAYSGIGHLPKNERSIKDLRTKMLLNNLPQLLEGYGKTYSGSYNKASIIVVCDLDDRCLKSFKDELLSILNRCNPKPLAFFCIVIEEGEAWLLGDLNAIHKAFPEAKLKLIESYINDSIIGTWELLADVVYPGGRYALINKGPQVVGAEKSVWAQKIAEHMDIFKNNSPSFNYFLSKIKHAAHL